MKNLGKKVVLSEKAVSGITDLTYDWNKHILIVEDEKSICEIYADILSPKKSKIVPIRSSRFNSSSSSNKKDPGYKFDITICQSYDEALEEFHRAQEEGYPYAMGFFDVMLGSEKDGYDLVREMYKKDPHLYAVFVTAYSDRSIESINHLLGGNMVDCWDYLNKPFSKGEILQKARNFISLWNLKKEGELKAAQLAEAQNRLLEGEKMASLAVVVRRVNHEFSNILMQIMGKADLCQKKDREGMRMGLGRIFEATQRARDILNEFKDISSTVKEMVPKKWCLLSHILEEALDLLEYQFKETQTRFTVIKKDSVKVKVNDTGILQVLMNLSINAMHAMGDSGKIDYSIVKKDDSWAEIRLRDYGPGIKQELLDQVLELFFTTKGREGTGLGLAICREIIEVEHRGQFKIFNNPTGGLEVLIRIPIDEKENSSKVEVISIR